MTNPIQMANDSMGRQLQLTPNVSSEPNQFAYRYYSGEITTEIPIVTIDVLTDLGRYGTSGYISNTSSDAFIIQFSVDGGANYLESINVPGNSVFNMQSGSYWPQYTHIALIKASDGNPTYEVLVL